MIDNDRLHKVIISGDFFAYPPEELENLEKELSNVKSREEVFKVLNKYRHKIRFVGINFKDLENVLSEILEMI